MSADKPDALESLAGEAEQLGGTPAADAVEGGEPGQAAPPPQVDNYTACGMLIAMSREALCIVLDVKSPRQTLADPKIETLARAWGAVADHYGVNLGSFAVGPLGLAIVQTVPIGMAVYHGLKAELDAKRAPKVEPAPEGAPAVTSPAPPSA